MKRKFIFTVVNRLLTIALLALPLFAQQNDRQDCWGSDKPCSDGQYRDRQGKEQPASCNNDRATDEVHKCHCARDTTKLEECPSTNMAMDMSKCQVYCREDACKCVTVCDFNDDKK
jgi:hypothetical protein